MRISTVERAIDLRRYVGRWSLHAAGHTGRFSYMIVDMVRGLGEWRTYLPRTMEQANVIGYGSLFIVVLTAAFAGGVTALQAGYQFTGSLSRCTCRRRHRREHHPRAGPGDDGADPGRPHRRPLRRRARHDAGHRADRRAGEPGPLARDASAAAAGAGRDAGAPRAGGVGGRDRDAVGLAAKQSLGITNAAFRLRHALLLPHVRPVVLGDQGGVLRVAVTSIPCYVGFNTQQGAEGVGRATTQPWWPPR